MLDPWGIGGFRGGGGVSPILSKSSKETVKKSQKSTKLEKSDFSTENGLKCITNPTKHL